MTRVLRWVSFCFTSCEPTDRRTNIWLCCCHSVLIAPSIKVSCCDGDEKPKSWPYHDRVWLMGCGSSAVMHVSFLHTSLLASKPKVFFKTFPQSIIHRDLWPLCALQTADGQHSFSACISATCIREHEHLTLWGRSKLSFLFCKLLHPCLLLGWSVVLDHVEEANSIL